MNQPRNGPEKYVHLMANTELGKKLATPAGRRAALYDMLAQHPDPTWREMGEQMRNGQMRPSDLFAIPAYREHLMAGLEQAKERHEEMFGAVEQSAAGGDTSQAPEAPAAPTTPRGGTSARDDDDPDELPINWVRR